MIIENPDAFKSWLTSILEPLCDADPAALAKYVYALVKKDKPIEELRDGMLDQLDVFLQHETKAFVSMLFKSLETHDYLKAEENKPTSPTEAVQLESEENKETELENHAAPLTAPNGTAQEEVRPRNRSPVSAVPNPPKHRVVVNRAGNKPGFIVTARAPPQEQTLVKLIPLNELLDEPIEQVPRRRDRRGDSLRDKDDRRRRRSRSWERRARNRRHRDDVNERNYDKRRPVSRSPSPRGRYRNRSPPNATNDRPHSRSRSRSPPPNHERERLRVPRDLERDRMSRDREHRDRATRDVDRERSRDRSLSPREDKLDHLNQIGYKKRCRDFDEKGYCMRGDLCQWDHGVDPVVVDDLTRVINMPPTVPEYNPLAPDIWCGTGGPAYPPHHLPPHPMSNRELIPIPTAREPPIPGAPPIPPPIRHSAPPKKLFDYNRLGNQRPHMGAGGNCSLEVKKVPRGMNDITHLNSHFGKFGKIINIQVCFEGDPEAALITFSNHTEANVAYKSTEAVLNNRFIKVFWHNHENKQENTAPSGGQPMNKQNNGHNSHTMSQHKVLINRDNIKATADNKQQQIEKQQVAKEPANNGPASTKKETPKPMEKVKLVIESHKRAQALLESQLQQQQRLIQKMEKGNLTEEKRVEMMVAIKTSQVAIENLSKELLTYKDTLKLMQVKKPKTREEAQKEILDAELDMFNKQQEGQDVTELVKKIAELRKQMAIQFPVHPRGLSRIHSRGGRFNPTARINRVAPASKVFVNQSVDHRPRAVLISGFEPDELDALVAHFSQYGEVTGKEVNLSVPELILQYRARAHAELAAAHGRNYSDRTLSITWVSNSKPIAPIAAPAAATPVATPATTPAATPTANAPANAAVQNGDIDVALTTQHDTKMTELSESLLRFDEEDEEDAEDRSWRR